MGGQLKILYHYDKEVLDTIDPQSYDLPLSIFLVTKQILARELLNKDTFITSPKELYIFMTNSTTRPRVTVRENLMESLLRLHNLGLIELSTLDFSWSTEIEINAYDLLHDDECSYITFTSKELGKFMSQKLQDIPSLISTYLNILSYLDIGDILFIEDNGLNGFVTSKNTPNIVCYPSLDTLVAKRHSHSDKPMGIQKRTLQRKLHTLEELGLIKIITITQNGRTMNFYTLPKVEQYATRLANNKFNQIQFAKGEN